MPAASDVPRLARHPDERILWVGSIPFLACHLVPFAAIWTGVSTTAATLFLVTYFTRVFFITAGYHRYFSHRAYRVGRVTQFVLAFGGLTAVQQGPLWWAAHHRGHHRYTDTDRDPHTPRKGFWFSHIGWIMSARWKQADLDRIPDLTRYPELVWLERHNWVGPWSVALACFAIGGWSGLVVGFFASTVALWHATFCVNSLAHIAGRRRYATPDTSRNNLLVALLTLGEGWHNNHHHHPACARQGFRWWQIDPTYYVLRLLAGVGIVSDLKEPTVAARTSRVIRPGEADAGMAKLAGGEVDVRESVAA